MSHQTLEESNLRQLVIEHLTSLGFEIAKDGQLLRTRPDDKDTLRQLHEPSRIQEIKARLKWLERVLPRLLHYFADGTELKPSNISPQLVLVEKSWQHDLFGLARLTWSLPFSKGFGRRLRFLIMDEGNGKLIGILALQSPPLSFPPRDSQFSYPSGRKTELVNQTMDIQTLGAVPPYNRLLGSKLVALAAASNEVRAVYRSRYEARRTEMENRILPAHLVALTTTSAYGRSSIYNRLRYHDRPIALSLGNTKGYGSFHLMELYPAFRQYLEAQGIPTQGGYGTGPRRKWQTMVRALELLGFSRKVLRHGVLREAFIFPLISNLKDYLEGRTDTPTYYEAPFTELAAYWRERWLLPRVDRVDGWHKWEAKELIHYIGAPLLSTS